MNFRENCSFAIVDVEPARGPGSTATEPALAHIPFDFMVGATMHAAGPYAVEASDLGGMVSVRRADRDSQTVLVQAIRGNRKKRPVANKLLFYCQEDSYFLAQALAA